MSTPPVDVRADGGREAGTRDTEPAVAVVPAGGDAYRISVGGHTVLVDQPAAGGGDDRGPTPTELLIASLAGCVAFYAGRYLARHGVPTETMRVTADYDMAGDRPARVTAIRLRLRVPEELPEHRMQALLAVVSRCTVHNTLADPPAVDISLT